MTSQQRCYDVYLLGNGINCSIDILISASNQNTLVMEGTHATSLMHRLLFSMTLYATAQFGGLGTGL